MFGLFRRGSGGGATPSLDSVHFDTTGYVFQGEPQPGCLRVWHTPEGDDFGLSLIPVQPNLSADARSGEELAAFHRRLLGASAEELAAFYRYMLGESGGNLVEVSVITAAGCPAVRAILSVPQQPTGRTYIGSLTILFRDFSFLLECQCAEHGTTGVKEALLFDRSRAANEPMQVEGGRLHIPGWDPDAECYDAEFPHHPVARVRRVLAHVGGSLAIADEVRQLPGFALPK